MKKINIQPNMRNFIIFGLGVFCTIFFVGTYHAIASFQTNNLSKKSSVSQKVDLKEDTKTKQESISSNSTKNEQTTIEESTVQGKQYTENKTVENQQNQNTVETVPSQTIPVQKEEPIVTTTPETPNESNVVSYFEEQERIINNASQNDSSIVDKAKSAFTTMYQFLFQGGTIKGYTFSQLTTTAKLKVVKIALTIDHKIDEKFPNYQERIKQGFTNLKSKAIAKYLEVTAKVCERYSDTCEQARTDFKNMKENFGFTLSMIKNLLAQGSSALKEWYNSIR